MLSKAKPSPGVAPYYFINVSKRWDPGSTVSIAFRGGTPELHRQIAQVAALWTLHGNVGLDFGFEPSKGYRQWEPTATGPVPDIRIGFDSGGYWSCVGRGSVDGACAASNETSMNLGGFDQWLPPNWQSIVLHEFGHALGFEHEHQMPQGGCESEFLWDGDAGYIDTKDSYGQFTKDSSGRRPGIYRVLGGPPNNWSRDRVDFNLRKITPSSAFETSALDNQSIMKYDFPEWMYRNGRQSSCFSTRNDDLSQLDRVGMLRLYPRHPQDILSSIRERVAAVSALRAAPDLPTDLKAQFGTRLRDLGTAK